MQIYQPTISGSLIVSGSVDISGSLLVNGAQLQPENGVATLNFGSAPGTNTATVTVNTANVNNNSSINIYIMSTSSLNHNAEDHNIFALYSKVIPSNIIDNTSFDITCVSDLRVNGEFKVKYNIIN